MFRIISLTLFFALALSALGAQTATGTAGVYDDSFTGKKTGSGDLYDPKSMTAAVDDLRYGIRMAVTNPANGRTVTVLVNDSGPQKGHLLDLSRAAAVFLQLPAGGAVKIRLLQADEKDVVSGGNPQPTFVPTPSPPAYFQMGAFRTEANARALALSLGSEGCEIRIRHDGVLFRVYLVTTEAGAPALARKLTGEARKGFFQTEKEPGGTLLKVSTE